MVFLQTSSNVVCKVVYRSAYCNLKLIVIREIVVGAHVVSGDVVFNRIIKISYLYIFTKLYSPLFVSG